MSIKYYYSTTNYKLMFHLAFWSAIFVTIVMIMALIEIEKLKNSC